MSKPYPDDAIKQLKDLKRKIKKLSPPSKIEISVEAWSRPGARFGSASRIDWKIKGARAGAVRLLYERWAAEGCYYGTIDGGLINKKAVQKEIRDRLSVLSAKERKKHKEEIVEQILYFYAKELSSIIPVVLKPNTKEGGRGVQPFRTYIIPSLILDGDFGEEILQILQGMRDDIVLQKPGKDNTRLKGVGNDVERKEGGQVICHLVPRKHRLPGQYSSTAVDKEVSEEISASGEKRALFVVGGFGSSVKKPGGGEKQFAWTSVPALHLPVAGRPGEPSLNLNQLGARIVETSADGATRLIRTWSFRDLMQNERDFVTGIKTGANEIHQKIVNALRPHQEGLRVGELSDFLGIPREKIEKEIKFLLESRVSPRNTWPGLWLDEKSGRYNFHLDWFQDKLRYPWPYPDDAPFLKRLIFGCMHAGYTTTDYEYICESLPKIILRRDVEVLEIVGDIVAGLAHDMMHRGEIISSMNYTDQEIFASELVDTVTFKVFQARFEKIADKKNLESAVDQSLLLLVYILGNHDGWQKRPGITPGTVFHASLVATLNKTIREYLAQAGYFLPNLEELIRSKIVQLPGHDTSYVFPDGTKTRLIHPSMARSKTTSLRAEEALDFFRDSQLVDVANFHTTISAEKWERDLGQRVATQVGTLVIRTDFEDSKMKTVDFGPVYVGTKSHKGRIFMSECIFYNESKLKTPISKHVDVRTLRENLGVIASPLW